jgi:putative SOS response-associated peptidase YedK
MCGRLTKEITWAETHALYSLSDEMFSLGPPSNIQPRYNIAPTQTVDFVQLDKGGNRVFSRGR